MKKLKRSKLGIFCGIFFSIISILVILLISGFNLKEGFRLFYNGSLGNFYALSETLLKMVPLTIVGLGCAISFQAGQFNIGGEGQLIIGGLIAGYIGYAWNLPPIIHSIIAMIIGGIGGGFFALLPGFLKAKKGINEIISTIMLNYVALYFASYLSGGPMRDPQSMMAAFPKVKSSAIIPPIAIGTRIHYGLFVMIGLVILANIFLQKTISGFRIRAIGANPVASKYYGINVSKEIIKAMFISGFLCGIAGCIEVLGVHGRFLPQFSPGYGYDGITIALIGNLNPYGVAAAAFFFGTLRAGLGDMQIFMEMPKQLPTLMQGVVVLFLAIFLSLDFSSIKKMKRGKVHEPADNFFGD